MGCRLSGQSMTLHSRDYSRDPLDIVIERESRTCKGCAHLDTMTLFGQRVMICNKAKKPGKKCHQYQGTE
jgi:hypothetical protein